MSGAFSVGGLITGLDTQSIISQLVQIERAPISRIQRRIDALNSQKTAIRDLRTQLQTLSNRARDFELTNAFSKFKSTSSATDVLTTELSGVSPVVGSYSVQVLQLASSTVAVGSGKLGSAINPGVALSSSGIATDIEAGDFTINGVTFTVDPSTDTLNSVLATINASAAGVTATYNAATDKVTFANTAAADTSIINFSASDDDSNFLSALNVVGASQTTGIGGSTEVTSTLNLGAIDTTSIMNTVSFAGGAVTSGTFSINGIAIAVDVTTDSLSDIIERINDSDAQVTASYDSANDTIRVVADYLGSRTISFSGGTSNFLTVTNLATATQTAGNDSQFKINGGVTQTRSTNKVTDGIGGVALTFLSTGTTTITVETDEEAIVKSVSSLVDEFNKTVDLIHAQTASGGLLENDGTIRVIESYLRDTIFSTITGISGSFSSLLDVGISTGDAFDSDSVTKLVFDEDAFKEALRDDRNNVSQLFSNSDETGVANLLEAFLREATSLTGYLNARSKSNGVIDEQIESANDQIDRLAQKASKYEARLKLQFSRLEQLTAIYQQQGAALSRLSSSLGSFR